MFLALGMLAAAGVNGQAPPAIRPEGAINAASRMPSQFPGGAIARGSLFRILGVRLGPAEPAVSEVAVRVQKAGAILEIVPVYASATRIDAVLPASAPTGEAALTVTYKGQTSAPLALKVVESNFGIFTVNGAGWGPAITDSAAPGGAVTIHGTGLGTDRAPQVSVGGHSVRRILYAGPARCCAGQDEIRFEVPIDAPPGCYVPFRVRSGGVESNVATLAIAPEGRTCRATAPWLGSDSLVLLLRAAMQSPRYGDWTLDLVAAAFGKPRSTGLAPLRMLPPPGTCTAYSQTITPDDVSDLIELRDSPGGWLKVTGPLGSKSVTNGPRGPFDYWRPLGGNGGSAGRRPPQPLFLSPGDYTITGWGDPAIGSFQTQASVPAALEWTNRNQIGTIDRGRDLALTWNGAGSNDLVVALAANMDQITGATGICACVASGNAGRLTIPAETLAGVPPSIAARGLSLSLLLLARIPAQITAAGRVAAAYGSLDSRTVNFR
jgi:uncharacterized protein (TIGR03437 family)